VRLELRAQLVQPEQRVQPVRLELRARLEQPEQRVQLVRPVPSV
jgi:hypothetical protein